MTLPGIGKALECLWKEKGREGRRRKGGKKEEKQRAREALERNSLHAVTINR
jgi:hypothetical protein